MCLSEAKNLNVGAILVIAFTGIDIIGRGEYKIRPYDLKQSIKGCGLTI